MTTNPWDAIDGMRGPNAQGPQITGVFQDTFVTYRPLNACRYCQKKIDIEMETEGYEPPLEEVICPHVRRDELNTLLSRGVKQEVTGITMTPTTLPSGVVQVTVMWAEVSPPKGGGRPPPLNRL